MTLQRRLINGLLVLSLAGCSASQGTLTQQSYWAERCQYGKGDQECLEASFWNAKAQQESNFRTGLLILSGVFLGAVVLQHALLPVMALKHGPMMPPRPPPVIH